MNDRDTALHPDVQQAGIAVLATVTAIFIGFYVGSFAANVGSPRDLSSILLRSTVCAVPATVFALLMPRFWPFPFVVYGFGFYCNYTFLDGIGLGVAVVFLSPFAALTGQTLGAPPEPTRPELLWLFVLALCCAASTSFLQRHWSDKCNDT